MKNVLLQFDDILVPFHNVCITRNGFNLLVRTGDEFFRNITTYDNEKDLLLMLSIIADKIAEELRMDHSLVKLTSAVLQPEFEKRKALENVGMSIS